jgi:NAD(P)-dependent dehydrogenase (short-subunit alcohol dehydrogenase family)
MFDLSGLNALVTGASSGIGRHFAGLLARHGARVVLAARRGDALAGACDEIAAAGGRAEAVTLDVTDPDGVASVVGGFDPPIDLLVNNAGISIAAPATRIAADDWDRVFDTNLRGAFLVAQAVANRLIGEGRGGSVVNIASIAGLRVAGNIASYAASKAGLVHLTRALALEWARHDIRVNALCPGYIETDLNRDFFLSDAGKAMIKRIPQRRLGRFEDLDAALLLLAADEGRYITGGILAVDGGHVVSSL